MRRSRARALDETVDVGRGFSVVRLTALKADVLERILITPVGAIPTQAANSCRNVYTDPTVPHRRRP